MTWGPAPSVMESQEGTQAIRFQQSPQPADLLQPEPRSSRGPAAPWSLRICSAMAGIPGSWRTLRASIMATQARRFWPPGSSRRPSATQPPGHPPRPPRRARSRGGSNCWRSSGRVQRNPMPWGESRPLWPPVAKALTPLRSGSLVPAPWMPSTTRQTSCSRQAFPSRPRSSFTPSWNRIQETARALAPVRAKRMSLCSKSMAAVGGVESQSERCPSQRGTSWNLRPAAPRPSRAGHCWGTRPGAQPLRLRPSRENPGRRSGGRWRCWW